jgi:hypothetical protein
MGAMKELDIFMMDVENEILTAWDARQGIPKGPERCDDPAWAAHVKTCLVAWYGGGPSRREGGRAEVSWAEYVAWVRAGGGDDQFQG